MKTNLFFIPRLFLIYVLCFQIGCSNSISGSFFASLAPGSSFGTNGIVTTGILADGAPTNDYIQDVAIQLDAKTVVLGRSDSSQSKAVLARYNTDGSVDASFGGTGKVIVGVGSSFYGSAVAVQADGKILVAGDSFVAGNFDFALARYNTDGSLDTTFGGTGKVTTDIGTGYQDEVHAMAVQADGKIILGGYVWPAGGFDFALVRYNTDGTLDTTFGGTGKVATDLGSNSEEIVSLAIQADGKIVTTISGSTFSLVRYNSDGTLDTSFGGTGKVTTALGGPSERAASVAIQTDGKILAAGYTLFIGGSNFAVVRYNADGSLDTAFGGTGMVTTDIGTYDSATDIKIQTDGKIVVSGYGNAAGNNDFVLVRYNADGSLDTSFNGSGVAAADITVGATDYARAVSIQGDGKIVAAGSTSTLGNSDFALVRYNSDGSLDTAFGGTGKVTTAYGAPTQDTAEALVTQVDGKIVIAGHSNPFGHNDFVLVRYHVDGSLDTSFGGAGKVITDIGAASDDHLIEITLQADGKIVAVGNSNFLGAYDFTIVRYQPDGSLDTTFGSAGKVRIDIGTGSFDQALSVVIQTDGKILVAGSTNVAGNGDFALARLNQDGSLDTTFGGTGKVNTDIGTASSDHPTAVRIQADGKIVAAGYTNDDFALVRYNVDGSLDTSFGSAGKVTTDIAAGSSDYANALAIQADGKIVAAGDSDAFGVFDFTLVRYNSDGSLDTTFNGSGIVRTDIGTASDDFLYTIAVQADGKILAAGEAEGDSFDFTVVRYNTDGSLDSTFNGTGKVTTGFATGSYEYIKAIAPQADGKILAAGTTSVQGASDFALVRYNADGSR